MRKGSVFHVLHESHEAKIRQLCESPASNTSKLISVQLDEKL